MPPPPIIIDAQAISGITGSISIACWIIVFAPQIYENFKRKSSEGLSLTFVVLWLAGDVFNVLGSVLQGVLPTMIILAIYYTLADIVLLGQCLVYGQGENADLVHLSPASPLNDDVIESAISSRLLETEDTKGSRLRNAAIKCLLVGLVIAAGLIGWYIMYVRDYHHPGKHHNHKHELVFDPLAQFFGWLCAILYLGSRVPQIMLNYQRKSVDGISFMFFLFACLGNVTYVISILSLDTSWNYIWVNSSWLAGSLGTLAMDFTIFVQFFIYNEALPLSSDEESSLITDSSNSYGAN